MEGTGAHLEIERLNVDTALIGPLGDQAIDEFLEGHERLRKLAETFNYKAPAWCKSVF